MPLTKYIPTLILGATAMACSRTALILLDDPEGPNLLVVTVLAACVYFSALSVYVFAFVPIERTRRLHLFTLPPRSSRALIAISFIQVTIAAILHFLLR